MDIPQDDLVALRREKYGSDADADMNVDIQRLAAGEPLAYVIGTQPFLGLDIHLNSHPLIPRPETEWWANELCAHISGRSLCVLDLCAGSGAIGLAVVKHCANAEVFFGEIEPAHCALIKKNIEVNGLDASRLPTDRQVRIRVGDLFAPFEQEQFDIIACNPPYIPSTRTLAASVRDFEPAEALFAGVDGLDLIRRIAQEVAEHIKKGGELWLECDTSNIEQAQVLLAQHALRTEVKKDQYGRPRLVIAYY